MKRQRAGSLRAPRPDSGAASGAPHAPTFSSPWACPWALLVMFLLVLVGRRPIPSCCPFGAKWR